MSGRLADGEIYAIVARARVRGLTAADALGYQLFQFTLLRSNGNITVAVGNLARRGLVRRTRRRDDRRFVTVALTDKGREIIETLFPRHVALVVREMNALSRREQALLGRLCRRVGRAARGSGKDNGDGAARNAVRLARAV